MTNQGNDNESKRLWLWQSKLKIWLQLTVSILIVLFLLLSAWQINYLQKRIEQAPDLEKPTIFASSGKAEQNAYILEYFMIQRRYHQANVVLMSRIWVVYLSFIAGIILAIVGAGFILAKIRETPTNISASSEALKISIISSSPGIIMVFLGVVLIIITVMTKQEIDVVDANIYLQERDGKVIPYQRPVQVPDENRAMPDPYPVPLEDMYPDSNNHQH